MIYKYPKFPISISSFTNKNSLLYYLSIFTGNWNIITPGNPLHDLYHTGICTAFEVLGILVFSTQLNDELVVVYFFVYIMTVLRVVIFSHEESYKILGQRMIYSSLNHGNCPEYQYMLQE